MNLWQDQLLTHWGTLEFRSNQFWTFSAAPEHLMMKSWNGAETKMAFGFMQTTDDIDDCYGKGAKELELFG